MIYLLYGLNEYLINEEVKKIQKKENIDDINVINYTFNENIMDKIIEECNLISLFSEKKLIVVSDTTLFNRVKLENLDIDMVINYFNNYNPDNFLVFISNQETIDNTKKITKLIKEKGIVKEFNNTDIKEITKKMFDNYKISYDDLNFLIKRVGKDLNLLENEITKIKIYKDKDLNITKEDIIKLTSLNIDISAFNFVDQIVNKNKDEAIKIFNEMMLLNNDSSKSLALLASKFRLSYQAGELRKMGYSIKDIMTTLGVLEYPVKLAIDTYNKTTSDKLLKYLNDLADLDYNIKSGNIDANLGMQLFILNI